MKHSGRTLRQVVLWLLVEFGPLFERQHECDHPGIEQVTGQARQIRIVLVTTSFPQGLAGQEAAGSFVLDFARELSRQADLVVVAPSGTGEEVVDDIGGIRVYQYIAPHQPLSALRPADPRHWKAIATTILSGRRQTLLAATEGKADCILALWALPSGHWARNAARRLDIPYGTWALGSDIWSLGRLPVVRTILASTLANARLRFADGHNLLEEVEQICGQPCNFLPSARKLPACGIPLNHGPPYRLVFLGRWHPNKGIDLLLDALALLPNSHWSRIEAVRIAGGGPLEPVVQEKADQLTRSGCPVSVEGYKDLLEATELLTWGDLILIPSRIESIPVIFHDALQACRRILATPVGDFPRLASDPAYKGFLVLAEEASAGAIATALKGILEKPGWAVRDRAGEDPVSAAARKFVTAISLL